MDLADRAEAVLFANHTGRWTRPSAKQYPHQWNWDSGFISIGWSLIDWSRAELEIQSMLEAQWVEGMLPSVHFDRQHLHDYFPGPDRWPRAQQHVRRPGELTSGISNPPMLPIAARLVGERNRDAQERRAFWQRVLAPLVESLRYFRTDRRLPGSPLVTVVHPWETGWDNSPRWDLLQAAGLRPKRPYERLDTRAVPPAERPSSRDYDGYVALPEILDDADYRLPAYRARTPFLVHDVVFDALTYRAMGELDHIAADLGLPAPFPAAELTEFQWAFEEYHWNERHRTYYDYDCVGKKQIETPSAAALAALGGHLVEDLERVTGILEEHVRRSGHALPIPTVPSDAPTFDPVLYWRGPVWVNVNWLAVDGLLHLGLEGAAEAIREQTLDRLDAAGLAEYFNPLTGAACGAPEFSWSAALALDFLANRP